MGVTVSVNNPSFPEGTEFAIDHLGVVPNGGSLEVPEENEAMFVADRGMSIEDAFKDNEMIKVSGSSTVEVPEKVEEETEGSEGEVN